MVNNNNNLITITHDPRVVSCWLTSQLVCPIMCAYSLTDKFSGSCMVLVLVQHEHYEQSFLRIQSWSWWCHARWQQPWRCLWSIERQTSWTVQHCSPSVFTVGSLSLDLAGGMALLLAGSVVVKVRISLTSVGTPLSGQDDRSRGYVCWSLLRWFYVYSCTTGVFY